MNNSDCSAYWRTAPATSLAGAGFPRPAIAVITGMRKPWRTLFSERDYQHVQELGREHQQNYPRRIAT
jgi:hypothetical protein